MKKIILLALVVGISFAFYSLPISFTLASTEASVEVDPQVITKMQQLTYIGSKSGEGYFSHDGRKMVFQSEREKGNPFYQIYLMDLENGKSERVSTGLGKTTCAWIHPSGQKVMFSSTHKDPKFNQKVKEELEQRKSTQKSKYSWSFDDQFEIFEFDLKKKTYQSLTKALGYDAEGSYSPNGQLIAFASNRHAYTEKLNEEDEKIFKMDPSYLMSIYVMNSDGSNVRRLTSGKGYNGGPFFSADGKKITWRKFTPNGQSAEVWTMNVDGTDQKQITRLGAMSWAPYFHPSGDYVIFTTNKIGYSNFELYIVDSEGKSEPVRVSFVSDFDGLPVFSPDGQKLSWTHRNEKNESQIYIADWNDQKARELLKLPAAKPTLRLLKAEIRKEDTKTFVQYIASEEMGGRATGSPEEKISTEQIYNLFQEFGLKPTYQDFDFASGVKLGGNNRLTFYLDPKAAKSTDLKLEEEFSPLSFSKTGNFPEMEVVFAGYGIVAPPMNGQPLYDSFRDLDVQGKWVLVFRDIPENISNEKRIHLNMYSRLHHKALVASQRGAKGLLVVTGPNNPTKQKVIRLRYDGTFAMAGIPILSLSDQVAEQLLSSTGRTLKKWQDVLDTGEIQTTPIKDAKVSAQVDLETTRSASRNVIAKLEAKGAKSSLVIAAHGDHLGRGLMGSSLAKDAEKGKVHFGADDNASGVAGVLELAQYFQNEVKSGRLKLKYNLIFAVWSGEEIGLIGSTYFMNHTSEKILANVNMDMIGRLKDKLIIQGLGSAEEWKSIIEEVSKSSSIALTTQDDPYLPTDSMAFYLKEAPAINFFTGSHSEYHSPRDTASTINHEGLVEVLDLVKLTVLKLNSMNKLTYAKVEGSRTKLEGRSFRIYLGTIPDYTQEGVKGVRISGTSKDSPAEKAGLKTGDVITELAGIKIENLYDYVYCLQSIKAGQKTEMKVERDGKTTELSILPALKE